jgi:CBS domain-containing protein
MRVGEAGNRTAIVADSDTGIAEAAQLMCEHHVGALVIVDRSSGAPRPIGIVTDRDLVIEVMAKLTRPEILTVADLMSPKLIIADEDDDLLNALERMRGAGIRRMPVVSKSGVLVGLLAVDDVIDLLAELIGCLPRLVRREQEIEATARP